VRKKETGKGRVPCEGGEGEASARGDKKVVEGP